MGEDSILERVTAAAEERQLSQNSLIAYRRTWLKIIAWAAAEGLVLETFPTERVGEFYEEATRGRSASHHLQVKAALALLYHVLGSPNHFAEFPAPKFAPEKTELRYHTSSQLGQLLRELREDKGSYFGHLTYHLANALFFTGCRYHEWALLTMDRLLREPGRGDYRCPPPGQRRLVSRSASHNKKVGEIAAKAVVQLLFATGKSFTVDGLREKLREFFRQEVRAELRAVAALNNVELITALISFNCQLALVGLQLRILNGVVSPLTTEGPQ